jgi:hypothetical protein
MTDMEERFMQHIEKLETKISDMSTSLDVTKSGVIILLIDYINSKAKGLVLRNTSKSIWIMSDNAA